MTKREAAIVAAYTGYLIGDFSEMHQLIEEVMGRPVWTHELISRELMNQIQDKVRPMFVSIKITD